MKKKKIRNQDKENMENENRNRTGGIKE